MEPFRIIAGAVLPATTPGMLTRVLGVFLALGAVATSGAAEITPDPAGVRLALGSIPVIFAPNRGQADSAVRFLGRGPGGTMLLYDDGALAVVTAAGIVLRQSLVGGSHPVRVDAADPLEGRSHFFHGHAQDEWQTDVPHFSRVTYRDVYPGIDLVYHGNAGALQYDWMVAPGADPGSITLAMEGPTRASLDEAGHLLLDTTAGKVRIARPVAYQVVGGMRRNVEAAYMIDPSDRVRYAVGGYDPRIPLVIDPILQASTFLGGDGLDVGQGIALDAQGNVYVTGETLSPNFPLKNQVAGPGGDRDVFITKLDPTLSTVIYSTYLGGGGADRGWDIAVDPQGNAYVTGSTQSSNFPVTSGVIDTTCGSDGACNPGTTTSGTTFHRSDVFIVKLTPGGQLAYSTYVGDSEGETGFGIAVDALGSAYVTGSTQSRHFPTTPGVYRPQCQGGNPLSRSCTQDAFVLRINGTASDLVYSTFLGGTNVDTAYSIAIDVNPGLGSAAYITGSTQSADFPTTAGSFRPLWSGGITDAFVTKLDALGRTLLYSSFLGGNNYDDARGIAVDANGAAYVIGQTLSADFPTTAGALDTTCGTDGDCNSMDVFVSKLNAQGSGLVYSTFLGGSGIEFAGGIAVDGSRRAFVTGETTSTDFPVDDAVQTANAGGAEAFVARVNVSGTGLGYSTYLGGYASDNGRAIAVDAQSNAYITGFAGDAFPTTGGAFQRAYPGASHRTGVAFVARIGEASRFWWLVALGIFVIGLLVAGTMQMRRRQT